MFVWNVGEETLHKIAGEMDMFLGNFRRIGRAFAFQLTPNSSHSYYARRAGYNGRRLKAACHHGLMIYIWLCFESGATRVKTCRGDWRSLKEFKNDLRELAWLNIGSMMRPAYMIELCDHQEQRVLNEPLISIRSGEWKEYS